MARTDPATHVATGAVSIVHRLAGRTRLRIGALALDAEEAAVLATALSALPGVGQVSVERRAASVLCFHDREVDPDRLLVSARAALTALAPAAPPATDKGGAPAPSGIAREVARLFRALDHEVRDATDGRLDLGTLTTLGFLGAGALEVAIKRRLPAPPWFNLAWWGFRTFLTFEGDAIRAASPPENDQDGEAADCATQPSSDTAPK
jgi:Heavy metal associated domain 2